MFIWNSDKTILIDIETIKGGRDTVFQLARLFGVSLNLAVYSIEPATEIQMRVEYLSVKDRDVLFQLLKEYEL